MTFDPQLITFVLTQTLFFKKPHSLNNLLHDKSSQYFCPSVEFLAIPKHGSLAHHNLYYVCLLYFYEGVYAKKKKRIDEEFSSLLLITLLDYYYRLHDYTKVYTQFLTINTFIFMFPIFADT